MSKLMTSSVHPKGGAVNIAVTAITDPQAACRDGNDFPLVSLGVIAGIPIAS